MSNYEASEISQKAPTTIIREELKALKNHIETLDAKLESYFRTVNMTRSNNTHSGKPIPLYDQTHLADMHLPARVHFTYAFKPPLHEPTILDSCHDFKAWQALMYSRLDQMHDGDEKARVDCVLDRTGGLVRNQLMDMLPLVWDGDRYCSGSAKQLVRNLAQYYDEDVRKIDMRFGFEGCGAARRS